MPPAPQLPLALRYPPDQRLETFVGAPAGAIGQVRALADTRGADWVYLAGPRVSASARNCAIAPAGAATNVSRRWSGG